MSPVTRQANYSGTYLKKMFWCYAMLSWVAVTEMPNYRYRALMTAWQAQAKTGKNKATPPSYWSRLGTRS